MLTAFLFSFTFAAGLLIAGVSRRMNVVHGFSVFSQWTPVLLITFGVAIVLSFLFFLAVSSTYYFILILETELYSDRTIIKSAIKK
jgi:hypothetical protein